MKTLSFLLLVLACGGQTAPTGADASADANEDAGPISECHGYCPQPNGSKCASDCDCYEKCLANVCADPTVPAISCDDAAACPSGQKCGTFGACADAPCNTSDDCPPQQQCMAGACSVYGCL